MRTATGVLLYIIGGALGLWFWLAGIVFFTNEFGTIGLLLSVFVPPADIAWPALAGEWQWYGILIATILLALGAGALLPEEQSWS